MSTPYSYDLGSSIGRIRLLIPDRHASERMFTDGELEALLVIEGESVKRAVALALETIAADEALVQKATRLLEFSTDGPAVARILLARATALRTQATDEDAATDGGAFDWAEIVTGPFGERERIESLYLRGEVQRCAPRPCTRAWPPP
jgi:hypothetical protein